MNQWQGHALVADALTAAGFVQRLGGGAAAISASSSRQVQGQQKLCCPCENQPKQAITRNVNHGIRSRLFQP